MSHMPQAPQRQPTAHEAPVQAVGAIVIDRAARVLLIRRARDPAAGIWTVPGGRVEPGESLAGAILRELEEETGVVAQIVDSLGCEVATVHGVTYAIHEHLFVAAGDPALRPGDDAAEVLWASGADFAGLEISAQLMQVIERGLARAREMGLV